MMRFRKYCFCQGEMEMKERRKLSRKIWMVLLAMLVFVTSMEVSVPAASKITIRDGKVYQNNKLVTNKIVGSKTKGYYYVDKTGCKVNTREIRQAVDFVMRNSKAGDSRAKFFRDAGCAAERLCCDRKCPCRSRWICHVHDSL